MSTKDKEKKPKLVKNKIVKLRPRHNWLSKALNTHSQAKKIFIISVDKNLRPMFSESGGWADTELVWILEQIKAGILDGSI